MQHKQQILTLLVLTLKHITAVILHPYTYLIFQGQRIRFGYDIEIQLAMRSDKRHIS